MAFNIPTNLYQQSYSGWDPAQNKQGILASLQSQLFGGDNQQNWDSINQVPRFYQPALNATNQAYDRAIKALPALFKNKLQPALQGNMNDLAAKGMLSSTVAGDTMAGTARNMMGDVAGAQAGLEANRAGQLGQIGQAQAGAQTGILGQLLGNDQSQWSNLAQLFGNIGHISTSSDKFEPWAKAIDVMLKQLG